MGGADNSTPPAPEQRGAERAGRVCPWCNVPIQYLPEGGWYCNCSSRGPAGPRKQSALWELLPLDSTPEWLAAREAVQRSAGREAGAWERFAGCGLVQIYTDGSAPIKNPGGPAGFAAVVLGYAGLPARVQPDDAPHTRLDLGGYIPARIDGGGLPSVGRGPASGVYRLWSRNGRTRLGTVRPGGDRVSDEAEYLTLIAALGDLLQRITAAGHSAQEYSLAAYSRNELMVKQLKGEYRVKSAILQPCYQEARGLLDSFKQVEVIWRPGRDFDGVFGE